MRLQASTCKVVNDVSTPPKKKSLGNRRIPFLLVPEFSVGGSYLEMPARDKKGSIFYGDEVNKLPPADRTTGVEISGTTGSQIR